MLTDGERMHFSIFCVGTQQVGTEKFEGEDDAEKAKDEQKQKSDQPGTCTGPPKEEGGTCGEGKQVSISETRSGSHNALQCACVCAVLNSDTGREVKCRESKTTGLLSAICVFSFLPCPFLTSPHPSPALPHRRWRGQATS